MSKPDDMDIRMRNISTGETESFTELWSSLPSRYLEEHDRELLMDYDQFVFQKYFNRGMDGVWDMFESNKAEDVDTFLAERGGES